MKIRRNFSNFSASEICKIPSKKFGGNLQVIGAFAGVVGFAFLFELLVVGKEEDLVVHEHGQRDPRFELSVLRYQRCANVPLIRLAEMI